jgi:hypothetical protein
MVPPHESDEDLGLSGSSDEGASEARTNRELIVASLAGHLHPAFTLGSAIFPLRYYQWRRGREDPHAFAQLTRFLPQSVRARFEERSSFEEPDIDGLAGSPPPGPTRFTPSSMICGPNDL